MAPLLFLLFALGTLAWFFTIFNVLKTEFINPSNKIPIMLLVIFMPFLGMIIYWVIRNGISRKTVVPPSPKEAPKPQKAPLSSFEEELIDDGWQELK